MNKKTMSVVLAFMIAATVGGCSKSETQVDTSETVTDNVNPIVDFQWIDGNEEFTDRDLRTEYNLDDAIPVTLKDNSSECSNENVKIDGNCITISEEGIYVLSGELSEGQIIVEGDDFDKIQIILSGVSIKSRNSAAVYVKSANKVFIATAENTENHLETTNDFEPDGNTNVDATVFSKCDITFCGLGTLTVKSTAHGIVSKDDLAMTYGTYNIDSEKHSLSGKNSVIIAEGTYNLTAQKDGIHSENDRKTDKGYVYIKSGNINIDAQSDGIDAFYTLQIDSGNININAGDDGLHCENGIKISNGTIKIEQSSEGIEGRIILIDGGEITVVSNDDGLNAASSESSDDPMSSDENSSITITGGNLTVDADGDGIDSNGTLAVSGGTVYINGPTSGGDGALDFGSEAKITGGTVIATGMSNMAENFSDSSTQCSIMVTLSETTKEKFTLTDSGEKQIIAFSPTKEYNCLIISSPDIARNETYTLTAGNQIKTIEMTNTIYSENNTSGKMNHSPNNGNNGTHQDGTPPEKEEKTDDNRNSFNKQSPPDIDNDFSDKNR